MVQLEAQKASTLAEVAAWPGEARNFRSSTADWTALEVLDHLQRTERAILDAVLENAETPRRPGLKDRAGAAFIAGLFLLPVRVKAPGAAAPAIMPGGELNLDRLDADWSRTRVDLNELAGSFTPDRAPLVVFRHPVSGGMTMPQVLRFLSVHITHHGYQLRRLKRAGAERSMTTA